MKTVAPWWGDHTDKPDAIPENERDAFERMKKKLVGSQHLFQGPPFGWKAWQLPSPSLEIDAVVEELCRTPALSRSGIKERGIPCPFWHVRHAIVLGRVTAEASRATNDWARSENEARKLTQDAKEIEAFTRNLRDLIEQARSLSLRRRDRALSMAHALSDEGRKSTPPLAGLKAIQTALLEAAQQSRLLEKEAGALRAARGLFTREQADLRLSTFIGEMGRTWIELTDVRPNRGEEFVQFASVAARSAGLISDEISPTTVGRALEKHLFSSEFSTGTAMS